MKRLAICLAATAVVSGCATTLYKTNISNIELDQGRTAVFQIPVSVIGGNTARLSSDYATALGRASLYRSQFRDAGITNGVRVSSSGNTVMISYVSQNDRGSMKNNFTATFLLNTTRTGETLSVVVTCPSNIVNDVSELSGLPWEPFIPKEKVVADVTSLCAKAALVYPVNESGEIDTSFNDSSVFANFTRKLKPYNPRTEEVKQYDLEKSKWFYLSDGNREYKIAVSVFPYRNGSKVIYRTVSDVTCRPSQPCDFDAGFSGRLRAKITEIAND